MVLAAATLLGMVSLWPSRDLGDLGSRLGLTSAVYGATVERVSFGRCGGDEIQSLSKCYDLESRLSQGPDEGRVRTLELPESPSTPELSEGDRIVLSYIADAEPGFRYVYVDRQRRPVLLWLALFFAVVVIALARLRGLGALAGLVASIVVILQFVIPAILVGESPVLVAIVGSTAVAFVALCLSKGFRAVTTVALLSTLAALALTVLLAWVFVNLAHFTGATNESIALLKFAGVDIDLGGLVLAGMVLAALGALDDVTVTQVAAVAELREANPSLRRPELYRAGIRIGRDHIASAVNTLALAYAGASLPHGGWGCTNGDTNQRSARPSASSFQGRVAAVPRCLSAMVLGAAMLLAGCGARPADGWVSVGTGDSYGAWERFAESRDGS